MVFQTKFEVWYDENYARETITRAKLVLFSEKT
jgi:hypothetical protein